MIEQEHIEEAASYQNLGPTYFAAQAIANRYMAQFEAEHFKPLADTFAEQFRDKLWGDLYAWLLADTESNLQSAMWRMVDDCVKAILSGEGWAMKRYALGEKYECDKVRETVAKHIPAELQDKRVADLEKENKRLQEELNWLQRMR